MSNIKISICIPTYNRAKYIERLLNNIIDQKFHGLEVVIVNDGSKDNTSEIVSSYESNLRLNYFFQENQGRAVALKKAIELANGEYIIIMDDEDLFVENAFSTIIKNIEQLKILINNSDKEIAGFVFLCEDVHGKLIGNKFPNSFFVTNMVSINADNKIIGDKKQIIKTEYLKKVLYDVYPNERRMPTYILWSRLSKDYNVVFINEIVVIKEYLLEGLTKNIDKIRIKSPMSSKLIYKELIELNSDIYKSRLYRIKNAVNFHRYNFHSNVKTSVKTNFLFNTIGYLLGYLVYKLDCYKYL